MTKCSRLKCQVDVDLLEGKPIMWNDLRFCSQGCKRTFKKYMWIQARIATGLCITCPNPATSRYCTVCHPKYRATQNASKEKKREYYRASGRAYSRRQWKLDPEKGRRIALKYRYGITPEDVTRLLEDQEHKCLICQRPEKLVIDHNHITGVIRGMLCFQCNICFGWLERHYEKVLDHFKADTGFIGKKRGW